MITHMEWKQWKRGGAHRKSSGTPFPVSQRLLEITGAEEGQIKEHVSERERKKSFLWFIYDAMKVCWTHQNMQQWSYCQGRWSVFIVDWADEQGKERGRERKLEAKRGEWLYCRRVLTISSLPHHRTRHKMATSFLLTAGTGRGAIWTAPISSPTSAAYSSASTVSHIYGPVSFNTLLSGF